MIVKWRIVVSLLSLVPIVLEALADGKITDAESQELASALHNLVSRL